MILFKIDLSITSNPSGSPASVTPDKVWIRLSDMDRWRVILAEKPAVDPADGVLVPGACEPAEPAQTCDTCRRGDAGHCVLCDPFIAYPYWQDKAAPGEPAPVAAEKAVEAVRWEAGKAPNHSGTWYLHAMGIKVSVYRSTPELRDRILRAFDSGRVSVRRDLIEAYELLARNVATPKGTPINWEAVEDALSAIDVATGAPEECYTPHRPCPDCGQVFANDEYGYSADYHSPGNETCSRRQIAAANEAMNDNLLARRVACECPPRYGCTQYHAESIIAEYRAALKAAMDNA